MKDLHYPHGTLDNLMALQDDIATSVAICTPTEPREENICGADWSMVASSPRKPHTAMNYDEGE